MSDDTFSSVFRTNTRIEDFFDDTDFVTKPRKAENFIRLGQTRQNRPLIMSHINKRMACFADDYATFLDTICGLLQIPIDNIEHFKKGRGQEIQSLLKSDTTDVKAYLKIFSNKIYDIGTINIPIVEQLLKSFFKIKKLITTEYYLSLDLVGIIIEFSKALEESQFIEVDIPTQVILSWWVPQLLEIASAFLLLSEPTTDGTKQSMATSKRTFMLFWNVFEENLIVTIYILFGVYLLEMDCLDTFKKGNNTEQEEELSKILNEHVDSITKSVREFISSSGGLEQQDNTWETLYSSEYNDDQPFTWRTINEKLPHTFTSATYLLSLSISDELKELLSLQDGPRGTSTSTSIVGLDKDSIFDRVTIIHAYCENLHRNWPILFTEEWENWLYRTVLFLVLESNNIREVNDTSFLTPELWDCIMNFLDLIDVFIQLILSLMQRKATKTEAENYFGEVVVVTKFMICIKQVNKIEI